MPLHDYMCPQCSFGETERIYEVMVDINSKDEIKCPECQCLLIKMVGAPAFRIN